MSRPYDYVVIGGGSAGCVLAARLSEDLDVTVLLLEAGPSERRPEVAVPLLFPRLFGTRRDWGYRTEPQAALDGRALYWPRGRMLGGSSSLNDMVWIRGHRSDYDGWAAAGATGWSFADLLPYFRRAEDCPDGTPAYHGVDGPVRVAQRRDMLAASRAFLSAAELLGVAGNDDPNGERQDGAFGYPVSQRRGQRESAATAYLRPAMRRRNLTVRAGALVLGIDVQGGRATAVRWVSDGRAHRVVAAREVLLCAGAIGSAHILLRSGIGPADELAAHGIRSVHDLPGVGRNLVDHPVVPASFRASAGSLLAAQSAGAVARYLLRRSGPLASNVAQAGAFVRTEEGLAAPDLQLTFGPVFLGDVGDSHVVAPSEHGVTLGAILLRPASRGRITLRSADPVAPPRIDPAYLTDDADAGPLLRGLRLLLELAGTPALRPYAQTRHAPADTSAAGLLAHLRATTTTMFHPVGTCRMGSDPAAVVDPTLRVRGLDGLRVVDASVMPAIPGGNTNAPTIALAERAADLLRGRVAPVPATAATAAATSEHDGDPT
ncbi:MAG: GMC family oxidoreductase [Dermatophilaceae bacterium]